MIIPKYYEITKIIGGIAHIITQKRYKGKWPDFQNEDDEICIACNQIPGTPGCETVRTNYVFQNEFSIFVDHKSDPTEPIFIEGDDPDEHRQLQKAENNGQQEEDADSDQQEEEPAADSRDQSPEPEHRQLTATIESQQSQQSADLPAGNAGEAAYHNVTSDYDGDGD